MRPLGHRAMTNTYAVLAPGSRETPRSSGAACGDCCSRHRTTSGGFYIGVIAQSLHRHPPPVCCCGRLFVDGRNVYDDDISKDAGWCTPKHFHRAKPIRCLVTDVSGVLAAVDDAYIRTPGALVDTLASILRQDDILRTLGEVGATTLS